ncbi:hypothetical protein HNP52_000361 [Sphingomonas kyeonggiensis]|uniref:HIRAN domain-containing protein n=1 Tax=Sphingomonas kyeonggiensis TaxID=1268553 RepID=A0A7W7JYX3_9SPHN|nr:HIRAN domain-containing protein [Sphingomonas kyeonggiensis]MBB4837310.1 hypothetical protein [Sphingomonas kyeonggiensis]
MNTERELSLAVVGIGYANADGSNRRFECQLCVPGEPVELRPEPKNKHDEYAVAVFSSRGVQLGYLTAERAPWIGGKLRSGEPAEAVFQELMPTAAAIRVRFGGGAPTLPQRASAGDPEPDFYPDEPAPDWGA